MEKHILSKSTFIKGSQCLKGLYLYKKRYFLRDRMPPERVATFTRGTRVGLFAQKLFPGGIDCGAKSPRAYAKAVEKTAKAISDGTKVIYEAAFIKHNTLVFLDILVHKPDGWHAYEVKSSIKLSPTYYKDASLQNFVIKESGLEIETFNLIHINPDYILKGELNITALFNIVDVTKECEDAYEGIGAQIQEKIAVLKEDHSPKVEIGAHCRKPYDCDFIGHCWKHIPEKSIFNIPSLSFEEKLNIYNTEGAQLTKSLINTNISAVAKGQINSIINNSIFANPLKTNELKGDNTKKALLKVFTFQPAIPIFEGKKPYENTAYGFVAIRLDEQGKFLDSQTYFSQESIKMEEDVMAELSNYIHEGDHIITFQEDHDPNRFFEGNNFINILTLFTEGEIIHPEITSYSFINIYSAIMGKNPWFKKVLIDRQAALIFEKTFRKNFEDEEAMEQISTYAKEWIKYFERLYLEIIKLPKRYV